MICPKCGFEQFENETECHRCGVIFAKVSSKESTSTPSLSQTDNSLDEPRSVLKELLLPIQEDPNPLVMLGQGLLIVTLTIWGFHFIFASIESNYAGKSILHLVNLPFHEAGHIIFSPFGRLLKTLGGTLFQLLMPAICMGTLLIKTRDPYGAAIAQWWLAESFMDAAPYINDARALKLILLGGVTGKDVVDYHDWEYILRELGLLHLDHAFAYFAQGIGIFLMLSALIWASINLWAQFKVWRN